MNRHYIEKKSLRREQMPTEQTEIKAERCSVFSYSVLRSYYIVQTDSTWEVSTFNSLSWRHARLYPRWVEQAWGHGCGLSHLAAAIHHRHDIGSRPRRKYLDYHPIDREHVITFTVKTDRERSAFPIYTYITFRCNMWMLLIVKLLSFKRYNYPFYKCRENEQQL